MNHREFVCRAAIAIHSAADSEGLFQASRQDAWGMAEKLWDARPDWMKEEEAEYGKLAPMPADELKKRIMEQWAEVEKLVPMRTHLRDSGSAFGFEPPLTIERAESEERMRAKRQEAMKRPLP